MRPLSDPTKLRSVCFVHDWLTGMRGGEKVLEAMVELFPQAPVYTLFFDRRYLSEKLKRCDIRASLLQYLPCITRIYRWLLPLFPLAVSLMNVKQYDLVISSSHCAAKGVKVRKGAVHVCYCHTPMRYLWDKSDDYLSGFPLMVQKLIGLYFKILRRWDEKTSQSVDLFIANSANIQKKIATFYRKQASVIYPPVDLPKITVTPSAGRFFLIVSALVPYKRIDIAIQAFNQLKLPLVIVGDGPLRESLEKMVRYDGIRFEGWVKPEVLQKRYEEAKALIFPGEEDFGIVPVEAQGYGKPVIAFGKGGAVETVWAVNRRDKPEPGEKSSGIFFFDPSPEALAEAVRKFQALTFDPEFIKARVQHFGKERFQKELLTALQNLPTAEFLPERRSVGALTNG